MNIAYIMYPGACYMGKADGSKMQAEIWANELSRGAITLNELVHGNTMIGKNSISYMCLVLVFGTMI